MEQLLQYAWKHRLFPSEPLFTTDGRRVEVINPGLWNRDAGPDFFNATVRLDGEMWVGNVEVHLHSTDWNIHGHSTQHEYDNVILHVVSEANAEVQTSAGQTLPQLVLSVPDFVRDNFEALMREETYPACYRVIPSIPSIKVRAWMSALVVERLEQKTQLIHQSLEQTCSDWERTFFISLARSLGFGVNSEVFQMWASRIDLSQVGKHRDDLLQVESFFLGVAGLLERVQDEHSALREREWRFLRSKFSLEPMEASLWKYLRMRPQNFPHVRLLQLAQIFHEHSLTVAAITSATRVEDIRDIFHHALPHMQRSSLDSLMINTAAPLLFCHGRSLSNEAQKELAFSLLEDIAAEHNHITRAWQQAGLSVDSAADSQALIQLKKRYCDRHDCLRCRFGTEYLTQQNYL